MPIEEGAEATAPQGIQNPSPAHAKATGPKLGEHKPELAHPKPGLSDHGKPKIEPGQPNPSQANASQGQRSGAKAQDGPRQRKRHQGTDQGKASPSIGPATPDAGNATREDRLQRKKLDRRPTPPVVLVPKAKEGNFSPLGPK